MNINELKAIKARNLANMAIEAERKTQEAAEQAALEARFATYRASPEFQANEDFLNRTIVGAIRKVLTGDYR